jgi:nucleotide-sensitive chloride channel 1A
MLKFWDIARLKLLVIHLHLNMLAQLSSPPTYVSQEEHDALTSSTPESFTDIPPILRFLDEEVEVVLSPATGWWEGKVKGKLWVTEE